MRFDVFIAKLLTILVIDTSKEGSAFSFKGQAGLEKQPTLAWSSEIKTLLFSETSGTTYPTTQRRNYEASFSADFESRATIIIIIIVIIKLWNKFFKSCHDVEPVVYNLKYS